MELSGNAIIALIEDIYGKDQNIKIDELKCWSEFADIYDACEENGMTKKELLEFFVCHEVEQNGIFLVWGLK